MKGDERAWKQDAFIIAAVAAAGPSLLYSGAGITPDDGIKFFLSVRLSVTI